MAELLQMSNDMRLHWASQVALELKNPLANAGDLQRCRFDPWVGKIPLEGPTPVFLPGESLTEEPGRLQFIGLQRGRHD